MNDFVAIEHADVLRLTRHALRLGAQLIIDIAAQSVEMIPAILKSNEGADLKSLAVFQEYLSAGHRGPRLTQHLAFDGTCSWSARWSNYRWLNLSEAESGQAIQG